PSPQRSKIVAQGVERCKEFPDLRAETANPAPARCQVWRKTADLSDGRRLPRREALGDASSEAGRVGRVSRQPHTSYSSRRQIMRYPSWLEHLFAGRRAPRRAPRRDAGRTSAAARRPASCRLHLEALEDRVVPSTDFLYVGDAINNTVQRFDATTGAAL